VAPASVRLVEREYGRLGEILLRRMIADSGGTDTSHAAKTYDGECAAGAGGVFPQDSDSRSPWLPAATDPSVCAAEAMACRRRSPMLPGGGNRLRH